MGAGTSTTGRPGTSVVPALLWTAWLLLPAYLVRAGIGELLSLLVEVPTDADRESARRSSRTAGAAAVGIPLLGAVLLLVATAPPEPGSAVPVDRGSGPCQEHSGGESRCPGG